MQLSLFCNYAESCYGLKRGIARTPRTLPLPPGTYYWSAQATSTLSSSDPELVMPATL